MLGNPVLGNDLGKSLGYMTLSKDGEWGEDEGNDGLGRHSAHTGVPVDTHHSAIPPRVKDGCHVDSPIWKKQQGPGRKQKKRPGQEPRHLGKHSGFPLHAEDRDPSPFFWTSQPVHTVRWPEPPAPVFSPLGRAPASYQAGLWLRDPHAVLPALGASTFQKQLSQSALAAAWPISFSACRPVLSRGQ